MRLNKFFVRQLLRYASALVMVMICCILLSSVAYRSVERYVIEVNELNLKNGAEYVGQNISKMDLVTQVISLDNNFSYLASVKGGLPRNEYLRLKNANMPVSQVGHIYSFSSYHFILFRDNDFYLSSNQYTADFKTYYGNLLSVGNPILSYDELRQMLLDYNKNTIDFQRVGQVSYSASGSTKTVDSPVLCIIRKPAVGNLSPPYVVVFILSPEDLVRAVFRGADYSDGYVRITNQTDGQILLDTSPEGFDVLPQKDYRMLSHLIAECRWEIDYALPERVIGNQVKDIRNMMIFYLVLGLMSIAASVLFFSYRHYRNVKNLLQDLPEASQKIASGADEYKILKGIYQDISENRDAYQQQLAEVTDQHQAILLETLITKGINSAGERELYNKCLPYPLDSFCLVLVRLQTEDFEQMHVASVFISEYLKECCKQPFFHVHSNLQDDLYVLSMDSQGAPNVIGIKELFRRIVDVLSEDFECAINVGISTIGTDISHLRTCYIQAQKVVQAFSSDGRNSVCLYRIDKVPLPEYDLDISNLEKLSNLLVCGEWKEVEKWFDRLHYHYKTDALAWESQKEQVFFTIRNTIYCAAMQLSPSQLTLPGYNENQNVWELLKPLMESSNMICALVAERKNNKEQEMKVRIIRYIQENYANPNLSAGLISQEIGISEKYLYRFIKEQSGETILALIEGVRIEQAQELLRSTDYSNEKIAGMAGFTAVNTFYRVFNKRVGISPGRYRSMNKIV